MALDPTAPRSRRALLGAGIGALAAAALAAIGRPASTDAADGDSVILGQVNSATGSTSISATGDNAIYGFAAAHAGVFGESTSGAGIFGSCATGAGVQGHGGSGPGVLAVSDSGRGGIFGGAKAPLLLLPSGAASHPARGDRGDLVVDKTGRLWFCKGGSHWKQLA